MELTIEKSGTLPPRLSGRKKGTGKSTEYEFGTKVYNQLEVGYCTIIPNGLAQNKIRTRICRLNSQNNTEKRYSVRIGFNDEGVDVLKIYRTA